jgi:REP element-mobilizing transposase RayT
MAAQDGGEDEVRQSDVAVFVHYVWATWDRLPLLVGEVEQRVYRAIEAKCKGLKVEVVALGGIEDHVHLLVRLPATLAVADLAKHVKGASSHLATNEIAPEHFFKWQGAYGAFSVSLGQISKVQSYIAHQREHHRVGNLNPQWESFLEPAVITEGLPTT